MVAHGGIRPVHSNSHHWLAGSVTCEVVWGAMALDKAGAAALSEVISAILFDVAVLEMGEDERGTGDVADLAGAGGDVLQGAPAAGEQRESAFA